MKERKTMGSEKANDGEEIESNKRKWSGFSKREDNIIVRKN